MSFQDRNLLFEMFDVKQSGTVDKGEFVVGSVDGDFSIKEAPSHYKSPVLAFIIIDSFNTYIIIHLIYNIQNKQLL